MKPSYFLNWHVSRQIYDVLKGCRFAPPNQQINWISFFALLDCYRYHIYITLPTLQLRSEYIEQFVIGI